MWEHGGITRELNRPGMGPLEMKTHGRNCTDEATLSAGSVVLTEPAGSLFACSAIFWQILPDPGKATVSQSGHEINPGERDEGGKQTVTSQRRKCMPDCPEGVRTLHKHDKYIEASSRRPLDPQHH